MYSLRAQFGSDTMKNAVHGSSTVEKAEKVIKEFFPEVEILPDGTVKGLSFLFVRSCTSSVFPYTHMTAQLIFVQIYPVS